MYKENQFAEINLQGRTLGSNKASLLSDSPAEFRARQL